MCVCVYVYIYIHVCVCTYECVCILIGKTLIHVYFTEYDHILELTISKPVTGVTREAENAYSSGAPDFNFKMHEFSKMIGK